MLSIADESELKFNSNKKYLGILSKVEIVEDNFRYSKLLTISNPKSYNEKTKKYEKFGKVKVNEEGEEVFQFWEMKVKLRKDWYDLEVFEGLEVFVFGNFCQNEESKKETKLIQIPASSSYKNPNNFNFMTIEPNL